MEKIGIICEYNPFHNGHLYHIRKIKEMYPGAPVILVLGGYFLQRGDVSLLSKWSKTKLALQYGVDLVVELPVLFGTNSADYFAFHAIKALAACKVTKIVFGSECDDLDLLKKAAVLQDREEFNDKVKSNLKSGLNYPSSLRESLGIELKSNDLLAVAYIKAINKLDPSIEPVSIQRTNDFNDTESSNEIVSAQNIRKKLLMHEPIDRFVPPYPSSLINTIDMNVFMNYLRYRVLTEKKMSRYLGVDEGIENRIKEVLSKDNITYDEMISLVKSKRYTESRIKRMFIHILLGIEKEDMMEEHEQFRVLGFDRIGQKYLKELNSKQLVYRYDGRTRDIERSASLIYYELTKDETVDWESKNKPIVFDEKI